MIITKALKWNDEILILSNLRSLFHAESSTLVIADLHLGKTTHFRKNGIGLPRTIAEDDLKNLHSLLQFHQPEKLVIAGDFFHAEANSEIILFEQMIQAHPKTEFCLVKGNHDRLQDAVYADLKFKTIDRFLLTDQIEIIHESEPDSRFHQISGHLHPGVMLAGKARQSMKFPAFVFNQNDLIMPAFSRFTGLYTRFSDDFRFIAVLEEGLIEI